MTVTSEKILIDQLKVAERMLGHLQRSWENIQKDVPLTAEQVDWLGEEAIDRLDLFLSRFGKLQDFMAGKVFRSLSRAALEDSSQDVSVLDTLNRMEKFGVLMSVDAWLEVRLLRNAFAHEYLTDSAAIAENINAAALLYPLLPETLQRCQVFHEQHIARPGPQGAV